MEENKTQKQQTGLVQATNRRKTRRTEGAGTSKRSEVRVGERKKCSQRNVPRKASKVTLYREIVEWIRCPEGSQKEAKKAFTEWHLSFHIFPRKWTLAILGPREKMTQTKTRDDFGPS